MFEMSSVVSPVDALALADGIIGDAVPHTTPDYIISTRDGKEDDSEFRNSRVDR